MWKRGCLYTLAYADMLEFTWLLLRKFNQCCACYNSANSTVWSALCTWGRWSMGLVLPSPRRGSEETCHLVVGSCRERAERPHLLCQAVAGKHASTYHSRPSNMPDLHRSVNKRYVKAKPTGANSHPQNEWLFFFFFKSGITFIGLPWKHTWWAHYIT